MIPGDRPPDPPEIAGASSPGQPHPALAPKPLRWLASADGLLPDRPTSQGSPGPNPRDASEFEATELHPRAADPDALSHGPPTFSLSARTAVVPVNAPTADPPTRPALPTPAEAPKYPVQPWTALTRHDPYDFSRPEPASRHGVPWGRLTLAFLFGLFLAGVVAAGALFAFERQYVGRILPGIRVGSVDLSGLDRDAARRRLAVAYASLGDGSVFVSVGGTSTEIPYSDFGRRPDVDGMVDAAFAIGRGAYPLDRFFDEIRTLTRGSYLAPSVLLDAGLLQARIHEIAAAGTWAPIDAGAVVTPEGYATTPSKAGQRADEGSAAVDAARTLSAVDAPSRVDITVVATAIPPSVSDASAELARSQSELMTADVVIADGPDSWTIPAATVHRWISFTIINNRVRFVIDTKAVVAELNALAQAIDRAPVSATIKLVGSKIVFGTPSVSGRTFDPSKTTSILVAALRNRALGTLAPGARIAPALTLLEPALTSDEARAAIPIMKPISSWTTHYQPGPSNGQGVNIKIPTATINGYLVNPGDTFSFWKAVGPVTPELGYTAGGAIIDGHSEPEGAIGGGICSCSTTLFNAAIRAGLEMGDRLNHFYYIKRYPLGLDATVFISATGQAQDMTWVNDTDYPVVIQGINGTGVVKFALWSVPNGRTVAFTDPIVKNYTKAHTETRKDSTLPTGTRKQIEYATDGQDVWVTRTVTDANGAVIHKETLYSHYATITGIILIGTG
jgi:vancomycin resistance protein YoaR